ncbi:MAG: 50S ribosomal protein L15 [Lentisphaerae bacterium]|jgi:large subunit ribosomal protein L15|nr:50S ribosomal protein L15 [Lentisphaerota bacterium]
MNLHNLKNTPGAKHRRKRVGRGESSGLGRTAGRGNKGQMSRSGATRRPLHEGGQMPLIRRVPKRGFTSHNRVEYDALNIGEAARLVSGEITPEALRLAGRVDGRKPVKILSVGELSEARTVKAHAFSAAARAKIEQAGGVCEVLLI